jgi:hypothetical protein
MDASLQGQNPRFSRSWVDLGRTNPHGSAKRRSLKFSEAQIRERLSMAYVGRAKQT